MGRSKQCTRHVFWLEALSIDGHCCCIALYRPSHDNMGNVSVILSLGRDGSKLSSRGDIGKIVTLLAAYTAAVTCCTRCLSLTFSGHGASSLHGLCI